MISQNQNSRLVGSRGDLSCATAVFDKEYARLLQDLRGVVMPILASAGVELTAHGFFMVKCEVRGGLASLVIRSRSPFKVGAWLYFQIQQSFGALQSSERVFWMYSVKDPNGAEIGKPGRLQDLNVKGAAGAVVNDFVATCKALTGNTGMNPPFC